MTCRCKSKFCPVYCAFPWEDDGADCSPEEAGILTSADAAEPKFATLATVRTMGIAVTGAAPRCDSVSKHETTAAHTMLG